MPFPSNLLLSVSEREMEMGSEMGLASESEMGSG
jgi:hypothetical protein